MGGVSETRSRRGGREAGTVRRPPLVGRDLSLIWIGTVLALGGLIVTAAFGFVDRTKDLLSYVAANEGFRVFFIVIGTLLAFIGLIIGMAGWFGTRRTLDMWILETTSETYEKVFGGARRRTYWRR